VSALLMRAEPLETSKVRHSRAGGNPIFLAYQRNVKTWIPAYAGMTGFLEFPSGQSQGVGRVFRHLCLEVPMDKRVSFLGDLLIPEMDKGNLPRSREGGSLVLASPAMNKIGSPPARGQGVCEWLSTLSCRIESGMTTHFAECREGSQCRIAKAAGSHTLSFRPSAARAGIQWRLPQAAGSRIKSGMTTYLGNRLEH